MSQSLGNLVVTLEANMVRFNQNMEDASRRTEQSASRMQAGLNAAKVAITALAGAASVGLLADLVKGAIDAADNLRDMSQKTGIAVEELNGLGFAAGQAGGSLESMVFAADKLNKSIEDAASGGKESGAAFKALGIDVIDASGNLKKADVVMAEVADQFIKYRDGPEKAAIALALFGKSGADLIPLLNDGGNAMRENIEYAKQYSGATTDLSNAADNFNDTMGKLAIQQQGFANAVAAQVLPVIQQLADGLLGAAEQSRKFETSSKLIAESVKVLGSVAYDAAADFKRLGATIAGAFAIQSGMFSGSLEQMRAARAAMNDELDEINRSQGKFKFGLKNGPAPKSPIEQFIDKYAAAVDSEQKLLATRMQMLGKYHNDEQINDKDFNTAKKAAFSEAERNTRTYYDAQIAALVAAKAKGLGDPVELQGRIDDLAGRKLLVGADKPAAPRLPGTTAKPKKEGKSDFEKKLEEGAKLVAKLKEQEEAYGLTGAALMEYQMSSQGYSAAQKEQALAHQANIDGMKAEDAAAKASAEQLKKFVADEMAEQKKTADNVDQISIGLMTELQQQENAHQLRLAELQTFHDAKLENVSEANALIEAENKRHEETKAAMRIASDQQLLAMAGDSASQLYSMLQQAGMEQTALGKALFIANKAIAVAEIIMNTEVAAAKALTMGPIIGPPLAFAIRAMGYASAGIVIGQTIASAEGGYDIPAGTNPVTQLHEKEMVLPKAQADVIRGLASGGRSGSGVSVTLINNGTPQRVVETREISPGQIAMIVDDAVKATAAQLADPNSTTSRAMSRNFNVPRSR